MNKLRREIMWAALVLIVVLTVLSVYGAFIGADRAQAFFNSTPSVVFWALFAVVLVAGLVAFRRLIRVPGLLMMHAGCILVIIGGALGSQKGYEVTGNDKILKGQMQIYEGQTSTRVQTDKKIPLFKVALGFATALEGRTIPQNLRQEFVKQQASLAQDAEVWVNEPGKAWMIADDEHQYVVGREGANLGVYEFVREVRELPFGIKLNDFRMEYYGSSGPSFLQVQTTDGQVRSVPAEAGREIDLGADGKAKIVRIYENLKITIQGDKREYYEDPSPGSNPALEVQITKPDGQAATQYVYSLHPGFSHTSGGPKLIYSKPAAGGPVKDYISELEVTDKDGKVLARKDIEVNHPLYYGGYHFYQSSYDARGGRFTVLQVVSDTGIKAVFAGYWLLCIGVIWHMWLRHLFGKIAGAARQASRREKQTDGN